MQALSDTLLARYFAGECSAAEAREIEYWADEAPEHRARLEALRLVWNARRPNHTWETPAIWANVQRTMRASRRRPVRFVGDEAWGRERRWPNARSAAIAAAILVTVTSVSILHFVAPSSKAPASVAMREYVTPRGQRATLQLPDGTRLVLAPASRLRIPADFGREEREVLLDGEALFDVAHDSTRPFRVRVKYAVAEDIGTRFDARGYAEDSVVAIAVARGAVALGRAEHVPTEHSTSVGRAPQGVILQAGDVGTLGPANQVTTAHGDALAGYLDWANGRLVFTDAPLRDVIVQLDRWYDIDIRLATPEIGAQRLTVTVLNRESPTDALWFVASILDLEVTHANGVYTFRRK